MEGIFTRTAWLYGPIFAGAQWEILWTCIVDRLIPFLTAMADRLSGELSGL